jgi:transcriptional regulator with XRE-family HTH domain
MYTIRDVIQEARRQRGWGQRQLAEASGVAQPNLAAIETGARTPSLAMVTRLVTACGLQLRYELEQRHADVDRQIDRLRAREEPTARLAEAGRYALLTASRLARAGGRLVIDGPLAARLHGAPVDDGVDRVWCHLDDLEQLRTAARRCYRDMVPLHPRFDDEGRLTYEPGDVVSIGESVITIGDCPPAPTRLDIYGVSIPTVDIGRLATYPDWQPADRVRVRRLAVLLELDSVADI